MQTERTQGLETSHRAGESSGQTPTRLIADGGVDRITACPDCDSSSIYRRISDEYGTEEQYRCRDCESVFAAPVERPPQTSEGPASSLTRALLAAHPDELRADGGRDAEPTHECSACGAAYYSETAAAGCCRTLVTDGGDVESYRRWGAQSRHGLAKRLDDADPDEIGGDSR